MPQKEALNQMYWSKRVILLFIAIILTTFIFGCNEILPPDVEIQEWEFKQDYWWYVEGTAKNSGVRQTTVR